MTVETLSSQLNIPDMPQKLVVDRRRSVNMFKTEGDSKETRILGMEQSSDIRGLFLADYESCKVKYFNRDTETTDEIHHSASHILNVLLLAADGSSFVTFESSLGSFFLEFLFLYFFYFEFFLGLFHSFSSDNISHGKRKIRMRL